MYYYYHQIYNLYRAGPALEGTPCGSDKVCTFSILHRTIYSAYHTVHYQYDDVYVNIQYTCDTVYTAPCCTVYFTVQESTAVYSEENCKGVH